MRPPVTNPNKDVFASSQFDFRTLYYTLRERAWVVVSCLVIAGLGSAAYLIRSPKIYAAKVLLQVEQQEQKVLNIESVHQENLQSLESLKTVTETLSNRALLARIISVNKLDSDPRFVGVDPEHKASEGQLVSRLAGMVDITLRKGTRLIDIRVEHTDPALTELVANSLVKEYIRQNSELNSSASKVANEFLLKEADELKHKLEASENALQAYREQTKSASLEDRQNSVVQKLKDLTAKVTEVKSQRIMHETAFMQARNLGTNAAALLVIPAVGNDPRIQQFRSEISRQESDLATMKQRYRERHPKYLQAQSQLAEWKSGLDRAIVGVGQSLGSAYESSKAAEVALEQAFQEQELAALDLNRQAIRYNVLARDVESDRALYQSVLNRIKETALTQDMDQTKLRIVQPAVVPESPVKPEKLKIILLGIFVGITAGFGLAFLLNALDRSIKTVDQAEEFLGLPVLSAIPKFSGMPADQRKLIMADPALSHEAESFRTLRTAVSMLGRKEDRRTFLFTSAVPEEGKTFCSLNFAVSLAQQGLRTLIIDCDLRRPTVEKSLVGNARRNFGLTDFLTGQKDFESVVHSTDVENFFFLPSGSHAPNPAELLAATGIDPLIEKALTQFDRVVVDSAPIHAVSDTLLVLRKIQTLCLVTRARRTPKNSVLRAVQILREADAPLAGVILNLLPRVHGAGYYYDSYYEYTYHGDYSEKPQAA